MSKYDSGSNAPQISSDYRDLLVEVVIAYILENPPDFISFAANYFRRKLDDRNKTLRSESPSEVSLEDFSHKYYAKRRAAVACEGMDDDEVESVPEAFYPKTPGQKHKLASIIKNIVIFNSADDARIGKLIDAMQYKKVYPKEYVIRQGEDGDFFYIISHGKFEAVSEGTDGEEILRTYDQEGSFGELSLLYNVPRACSVRAVTRGALWVLDRRTFRQTAHKHALKKRKMFEDFLASVPLLKELSPYERMNLADALEPRLYNCGERIIKQGDTADGMYFVENGTVKVTVRDKKSGREIVFKRIEPGGYFGELALLKNKRRAANIYADTDVKLAFLNGEAFERLLGPCKDIMKRNMQEYKHQLKRLSLLS